MKKTNKASPATELEKNVYPTENTLTKLSCKIDSMSVLLKHHLLYNKIFVHLAKSVLHVVLKESTQIKTTDIVSGVYLDKSTKGT